ncbi:DNA glycosylase [Halenospora varia]|nr:DNA glycosylase [Halenospora varia]
MFHRLCKSSYTHLSFYQKHPYSITKFQKGVAAAMAKIEEQKEALPHGLGMADDLRDGGFLDQQHQSTVSGKTGTKRKRNAPKTLLKNEPKNTDSSAPSKTSLLVTPGSLASPSEPAIKSVPQDTKDFVKSEDISIDSGLDLNDGRRRSKRIRGLNKDIIPSISNSFKVSNPLKSEDPESKPRARTQAPKQTQKAIPATVDGIDDVHIKAASEETEQKVGGKKAVAKKPVKKEAKGEKIMGEKKKRHQYGLTYDQSPFPDHKSPTPEECEEVYRLLSELHGPSKQPAQIPPPSFDVAGCGEVPDILSALLRTCLSANTSNSNSSRAIKGLKDAFGIVTSSSGNTSINWEAVHKANLLDVKKSIESGGLAERKSKYIKDILEIVYQQNCERRDALLKEKADGTIAQIPGVEGLTAEQKDAEIARIKESPYNLDWLFEIPEEREVMDILIKFKGIGVKTASCVILFCMQRPSFAVDTHVWRHCLWLDWVPPHADRDRTFNHCDLLIPKHLKYPLHQLFIKHGKGCYRCRAVTSAGTAEWEKTVCPIEHLVKRTGAKKQPGYKPSAKDMKENEKEKKRKAEEMSVHDEDFLG